MATVTVRRWVGRERRLAHDPECRLPQHGPACYVLASDGAWIEEEQPATPDADGLLLSLFDDSSGLGKSAARVILRDYPDLAVALRAGDWRAARATAVEMFEDGAVSQAEYDTLKRLTASFAPS